jgi:hypothetical protein
LFASNKLTLPKGGKTFGWEKKIKATGEALVQHGVVRTARRRHDF